MAIDILIIIGSVGFFLLGMLFFMTRPRKKIIKTIEKPVYKENPVNYEIQKNGGIPQGELLRVQDVEGFFDHDINPSYITSAIERNVAASLHMRRISFPWLMIIILAIIAIAAFFIVSSFLSPHAAQTVVQQTTTQPPAPNIVTNPAVPTGSSQAIGIT